MFFDFKSTVASGVAVLTLHAMNAAPFHFLIAVHMGMYEVLFARKQSYGKQQHRNCKNYSYKNEFFHHLLLSLRRVLASGVRRMASATILIQSAKILFLAFKTPKI